jgi:POT family proton-dependent oligopeptide transporter
MRAFLVLFIIAPAETGGLGLEDAQAGMIYGLYTSAVYLLSVPGGWLADRFVGQRQAVVAGGLLILCGHVVLALPSTSTFYLGLALVATGTGLLKPNISTLLGRLYAPDDSRRDAGFTLFYMGINLGAFAAPLVCGAWLAESRAFRSVLVNLGLPPSAAWHAAFGAAAVGMGLGLLHFLLGRRHLGEAGHPPPRPASAPGPRTIWILLGSGFLLLLALAVALRSLLPSPEAVGRLFDLLLPALSVAVLAGLFLFGADDARERRQLAVISVLFVASALFWGCFEQAGSTLTLFAARHTDRRVFGWEFGATVYQALNSLFVVALAPLFAFLWSRLAKAGREPSTPAKFGFAMILAGLGFLVLVPASSVAQAGPQWLLVVYLLHTCGELCLSPVGLSAMTRLAPRRAGGLIMGAWFLATSLGNYMAGRAVGFTRDLPMGSFFLFMAAIPAGVGVLLLLLAAPLRRMLERPAISCPEPSAAGTIASTSPRKPS